MARRFDSLDLLPNLARFAFTWVMVRDDVSTLLPSVFVIVFEMVLFAPCPDFVITIVCEPAGFVFERIFVLLCPANAGSAASEPEMNNAVRVLFTYILLYCVSGWARPDSYLICERRAGRRLRRLAMVIEEPGYRRRSMTAAIDACPAIVIPFPFAASTIRRTAKPPSVYPRVTS